MAVRVEPPRGRPAPRESVRYAGLTPEERGYDPTSAPEVVPEPPLWMIPSELPPAARPVGFVGALPSAPPSEPTPPEGLFDVPGLLERLWLARALEASHRERSGPPVAAPPAEPPPPTVSLPIPSPAKSGAIATPWTGVRPPQSSAPRPSVPPTPVHGPAVPPPELAAAPARPKSWICPYCYLTNDADATTCRGCRSGHLHL